MVRSNDDLWKAYAATLKKDYLGGVDIGTSNRIYIPPINSTTILAGGAISANTTSYGVARSGDALVTLNNPLYSPSNDGYAQRCLTYLQAVQLQSKSDAGLQQVADQRYKQLAQLTADFFTVQAAAKKAWNESGDAASTPFKQWSSENYPAWTAAASQRDAAAMSYDQVQTQIAGPGYKELKSAMDKLTNSLDQQANIYNMPVNRGIIGTSSGPPPDEFRPKYDIDQSYAKQVQGWINMAADPAGTHAKKTITIDASSMENTSWHAVGFEESKISASASWLPFFSVDYSQSNSNKHEEVNVSEVGSSLKVEITADAIQPFTINPSAIWNPGNVQKKYPKLQPSASSQLFDPMVQLTTIIVGYNVSTAITLDDSTFNKITNHVETAKSVDAGASASLFGCRLNIGGQYHSDESNTTDWSKVTLDKNNNKIIIPGANDTVPVLLAVVGQVIGNTTA